MLSRQIAQKLRGYETPFYLYDTALLRQTLESVVYESKKYGYKVHYAIKANYDDHLLAIIREYGLGIDCASGNELRKAIEAGFDPKGIVYAGVGKRDKELRYAIEQDILAINCESIEELELVDALAGEAGRVADVALRINPDIDPKTNHCIDTGQADSKFGISYEEVLEHAKEIRALKHINIIGLHLHIGSQIRELHVFENMCNKVNVIVENLEKLGCSFRFVDVGGGLGVNYDVPENEPIPNFASLFSILRRRGARQIYHRGHGLRIDRRVRRERHPAQDPPRRPAYDQVGRSLRHVDGFALQPPRPARRRLQRRDSIIGFSRYRNRWKDIPPNRHLKTVVVQGNSPFGQHRRRRNANPAGCRSCRLRIP